MRHDLLIFLTSVILAHGVQSGSFQIENKLPGKIFGDTLPPNVKINKSVTEKKWDTFWNGFTSCITAKDKERIAVLTAADFYDGGGSTVKEWLQTEVLLNDKTFLRFTNIIRKGVKNFKGFDGNPYKATGKNKSGDLFFEYKKGQWLFGGVVGD